MSGFRLQSKSAVKVEVNDKGEFITLDFADPMFVSKIQEGMLKIRELEKKYKHVDDFFGKDIGDDFMSEEWIQMGKDLADYSNEGRAVIDTMLGDDMACQKVFGTSNWYLMFDELFESLEPYFKDANAQFDKYLTDTKKKYANRADRRSKGKEVI